MLKDTLLKLLTIPGPSGFEGACADYIESEMRPCADEIRRDVMGNLVCVKKGAPGGKRILLTAHMDEIGFIITAIDEDGFLRVATVGGVNPKITQASHVVLASGAQGVLFAEAGSDPVSLFIDVGASSREEAGKKAQIGDWAVVRGVVSDHGRPPGRALHGRPLRLRGPDGDDAPPGQDGQRDRRGLHHPGGGRRAARPPRATPPIRTWPSPWTSPTPTTSPAPRRRPTSSAAWARARPSRSWTAGSSPIRTWWRPSRPRPQRPACPVSARSCWAAPRTPRPSTSPRGRALRRHFPTLPLRSRPLRDGGPERPGGRGAHPPGPAVRTEARWQPREERSAAGSCRSW